MPRGRGARASDAACWRYMVGDFVEAVHEAEARAPRMLPGAIAAATRTMPAATRPRRARLGCCLHVAVADHRIPDGTRPRRARLGCCLTVRA